MFCDIIIIRFRWSVQAYHFILIRRSLNNYYCIDRIKATHYIFLVFTIVVKD